MKPVKKFLFVAVLLFALAVNGFAGEQQTPGYVAPPPPPDRLVTNPETDTSTTATGDNSEQSGETADTSDYLFFDAITALFYSYPMY